ncbi:hypothetical protein V1639_15840 [Pseudarthrobacter sp. J75]|uniref:hypothetical protein n=1 Tax=unclassified Pseudarthrobacter TaxID=2647000 RepID=UPI002E7FD37E|nr:MULTISPECIES: hypothetical protein [unclassified Pseudarthrobacter]MEE2523516.1 hypothetical protein [Pseudarthrobacter sp. J47]MEE2530491.1 hypothetical protein [Pseudarthrobacter sp. J75]MEE2570203.1 hypothetical protein [Pseudarthrobacter sp. J64]
MKARGAVLSRRHAHSAIVADWGTLQPGARVEILQHAHVIADGVVEEVSQSGNVLWLVPAGPTEKQVFLKSDGVQVRKA